jgi:hypothetical protein
MPSATPKPVVAVSVEGMTSLMELKSFIKCLANQLLMYLNFGMVVRNQISCIPLYVDYLNF